MILYVLIGEMKPPIVLSHAQTTTENYKKLANNIENNIGDPKTIENPYYEGMSDVSGANKHKSKAVVNLNETEKVTTTENVYYKL